MNLSLTDTSLRVGYRADEKLYSGGVSASFNSLLDISVAAGYRVTTFETGTTEYGELYANAYIAAAILYALKTGDLAKFLKIIEEMLDKPELAKGGSY